MVTLWYLSGVLANTIYHVTRQSNKKITQNILPLPCHFRTLPDADRLRGWRWWMVVGLITRHSEGVGMDFYGSAGGLEWKRIQLGDDWRYDTTFAS